MKLKGIYAVNWAKQPGFSEKDRLRGYQIGAVYDAVGPWNWIGDDKCHGEYSCEEGEDHVCTHTLKFQLHPDTPATWLPQIGAASVWSFRDRQGLRWMIGDGEKPIPSVTKSVDNGAYNTEATTITVVWKSRKQRMQIS